MRAETIDFFDIIPTAGFDVPIQEAVDRFKSKGLKPSFAWQDVMRDEHKVSFTVAKMMDVDMLSDVKDSLDSALAQGLSFKDWSDQMVPMLQSKGWWGRKAVLDPLTGKTIIAQLGSPARLQTIFRTNMLSAYAAGHWDMIEDQAEDAPYLLYDALDDYRTRPEHRAWDGIIRPIKDTFWKFHTPPCGWNCRCSVIQLDEDDIKQLGMEVSPPVKTEYVNWMNPRNYKEIKVPKGVDPGFGHAAHKRITDMEKLLAEKVAILPADLEKAANDAIAEMNTALASKTPYLSTAIKGLQDKEPTLSPVAMLAKAKAKAEKTKSNVMLGDYKNAIMAGKTPSPGAQKAFDILPKEAQVAMLDDLTAKNTALKAAADLELKNKKAEADKLAAQQAAQQAALQAEAEATTKLADIKNNPQGQTLKNQILIKLEKTGEAANLKATELLAKVDDTYKVEQGKKQLAATLSGYKAKILEGKIPAPAQKAAFDSLTPDEKQAFLAKVDLEKQKQAGIAPAPAPAPISSQKAAAPAPTAPAPKLEIMDGKNLTQIGPQAGSNPGGLYQNTETGEKWYIKHTGWTDHARNEILTSKLYQLAGIDAPEYRLVRVDGQEGIASKFIDGLEKNKAALKKQPAGLTDGFGMDAWLANWDVIGADFDNMLMNGKKVFRVDTGGGLMYRARGAAKGADFGDKVTEIDSLRDPSMNAQAASVYDGLTNAQIGESVKRVLAISDDEIRLMVNTYGPGDPNIRAELIRKLIARKEDLAQRFPDSAPKVEAPKGVALTDYEKKAIKAARINGYTITVDKDHIEDHNVRITEKKDINGKTKYIVTMKLNKNAIDLLKVGSDAKDALSLTGLKEEFVQAYRGIGALARDGKEYRQKDLERFNLLGEQLIKLVNEVKLINTPEAKKHLDTLVMMRDSALKIGRGMNVGDKAVRPDMFDMDILPDGIQHATKKGDVAPWSRFQGETIPEMKIVKSHAQETTNKIDIYENKGKMAMIDGTKVLVFDGTALAYKGYTRFEVDNPDKALDIIGKMGINNNRATQLDRDELMLNAIGARRFSDDASKVQSFLKIGDQNDQAKRVAEKLAVINADAKFDITKTKTWKDRDQRQAFEHGRVSQLRPDLETPAMKKWTKDHVLFHAVGTLSKRGYSGDDFFNAYLKPIMEGGGSLTSLMDRTRRGMRSSAAAGGRDYRDGGASYVFTRIKNRTSEANLGLNAPGMYWKPDRHMLRSDRLTYGRDQFGDASQSGQSSHKDIPTARHADSDWDETIFKDGLSLFDDLEMIVVPDAKQKKDAIQWMRSNNIPNWPDGRTLEDVIKVKGWWKAPT